MRPAIYTSFDPEIDFMLATDFRGESEGYLDMVDTNVYNEEEMKELAERVCNEFYNFYKLITKKRDVETFKEHFDKKAWVVHVSKTCPDEYKNGYERFLPENASESFYHNFAIMVLSVAQKYACIRLNEL